MEPGPDAALLWHIVLISFRTTTTDASKQDVYERYQTLAEECGGENAGIMFWNVSWNLDRRKNVDLVEVAVFQDDAALQAFRVHPKHRALTDILSAIADWQVGDLLLPHSVVSI